MSFIMEHSCELAKSELDLFATLPTQTGVESGYTVEYAAKNSITDNPILKFEVTSDGNDYLDLVNSLLYLEIEVVNGDGTALADGDNVAPINLIGQTLFSQVDVKLNDTLVSQSCNNYHYRAYLETLLSYGKEAKNTHLELSLWNKDTAKHMESIGDQNIGFVARKNAVKANGSVQLLGRLHTDMTMQGKYLLNGVDLHLKLVRNPDSFCLMAAENSNYKLKIVNALFYARKVKVNPELQLKHIEKMEKGLKPAVYPVRRIEVKTMSIPAGNLSANEESLFAGQLPKKIIIGLVESAAYDGRLNKNPFNFQNFGLKHLALYCDGRVIPSQPLQPDFEHEDYARSYFSLYEVTGKRFKDDGFDISRSDYPHGYALYGIDLTPDLTELGCFHLIQKGNIRLELKFARALTVPVQVIVYSEFDSAIKIDRNRSVYLENF